MNLAFFGDVIGSAGRAALRAHLPALTRKHAIDFIAVNAENAAGGFGVTPALVRDMLGMGAHVLTTGNHAYDQRDHLDLYDNENALLRPANFLRDAPGHGSYVHVLPDDQRVLVVSLMGQLGMAPVDDPFSAVDRELENISMHRDVDAIIVDFHAEMTSEKQAMGHYLDGRVTLVAGTHTHVPTADHRILPKGSAYITDVGMTGDYDSVIGMEKSAPIERFVHKLGRERLRPATGLATLCGILVRTTPAGLAETILPLRVGGVIDGNM